MKRKIMTAVLAAIMVATSAPIPAMAANNTSEATIVQATQNYIPMYRLYNPNSGEHFYTTKSGERDHLVSLGWHSEGIGWNAPTNGAPVYRLYNPNAGDHHFTLSAGERDSLVKAGWNYEGIGWMSGGTLPVYRQYNPNARSGAHNFTVISGERNHLLGLGWRDEGTGFYAVNTTSETNTGKIDIKDSGTTTPGKTDSGTTTDTPSTDTGKADSGKTDPGKTDTKDSGITTPSKTDSGTTTDTPSTDSGKETVKDKGQRVEGNENYGHYEDVWACWCNACGRVFWTANDSTSHFAGRDGSGCPLNGTSAGGVKKIWVWDDKPYLINPYGEPMDNSYAHERFYSENEWNDHIAYIKNEAEIEQKEVKSQKYWYATKEYNMIKDYKWADHVQQPTK